MAGDAETAAHKLPFFLKQNAGLGSIKPEDDLLHPASFVNLTDSSATETQFLGFSVPEHNIHGFCYLWHHPNLRVVSGGVYVFQGIKEVPVQAEICDYRTYMSDALLSNDLHEYRLENGYGVKILEPNRRFHITYQDATRGNSIDVISEAVLPGVMWGDGKHFEQAMQVKGELVLQGRKYAVDCFHVRDRSWGKPRPEAIMPMPPISWMACAFDKDFAFNCTMFDQSSGNPLLKGALEMPDDKALNGGWVYCDGVLGQIVKARKRVTRYPRSQITGGLELSFSDDQGRDFDMRATLVAACPQQTWGNAWFVVNLMRWECGDAVGYGDHQEGFWGDYLRLC